MYRTTTEFSRLLKNVIGTQSDEECWCLIVYLYACFGVKLNINNPAITVFSNRDLWYQTDFKNKQFLDLLFFSKNHVGAVLDNTYFIHATTTVLIERYKLNPLFTNPVKVYRLCL